MKPRDANWSRNEFIELFATVIPAQGDGVKSIIIPGIVGVILGLGLGMAIFYT